MGKRRRAQEKQLTFEDVPGVKRNRGGRPKKKDAGVSHLKREEVSVHVPLHVTTRLLPGLPKLRKRALLALLWQAFQAARGRAGRREDGVFRLLHYSVQDDHLHLFVEAGDRDALSRGIQGLLIRIARALNKAWGRKGKVWADRFHVVAARTPRQVRNVIRYVLNNGFKHGRRWNEGYPDPFSSGLWFDGWSNYEHDGFVARSGPIAKARSWLARVGWRRHGLIEAALGGAR